jgi:predicted enzyme related to lactoylglutathione lyase
MNIIDIAFSAYTVTDVKRARAFYEGVLGLKPTSIFEKDTMAFIEYEVGASTLVIGAGAPNSNPGPNGAVVTLEVADFDSAVADLRKAGAKFVMEPQDTGVCHMTLIADPDGNYLMIHKKK